METEAILEERQQWREYRLEKHKNVVRLGKREQ